MNWKTLICVAGLAAGLTACSQATEPVEAPVDTSPDELSENLGSAKADGQDIRVQSDGRVFFYGRSAAELFEVGNVSPRTQTVQRGGLTYAQSPFAYCVSNGAEEACVSYLPNASVEGDSLTFGGSLNGRRSLETQKAYDLTLAMYHGGYEAQTEGRTTNFVKDASPLSCLYSARSVTCSVTPATDAPKTVVTAKFDMLPELGDDYVYEGWLIVDGAPISAGRFDATDEFVFETTPENADATLYILTIEPRVGDDPAPSDTHIVGGEFVNGEATVTIDHGTALGDDFASAMGSFFLAAPTAAGLEGDFSDKGIWFIEMTSDGPAPGLNLPELPAGWEYEGWVVTEEGPISTGRFTNVRGADSDAGGPAAGPADAPPFPGQDFVDPAMSLIGTTAVISVEPQPDNSPAPFALKPLVGPIEDDGQGVAQSLMVNGEAHPTGTVTIR